MAEARQVAGLKLAVKPDGKIEIDWSSGKKSKLRSTALLMLQIWGYEYIIRIFLSFTAEAALWLIFNSGARSLKRKWAISINAFKTLVYPFQVIVLELLFKTLKIG